MFIAVLCVINFIELEGNFVFDPKALPVDWPLLSKLGKVVKAGGRQLPRTSARPQ
jgi:hypothetical protein